MTCRCATVAEHQARLEQSEAESRRYAAESASRRVQEKQTEIQRLKARIAELEARTDFSKFEIVDVREISGNLVVKVKYPDGCKDCSYENNKVLVFLGMTTLQAIKWRKIDPHFREPTRTHAPTEAPGPAARFPASPEGWQDAIFYAENARKPQKR